MALLSPSPDISYQDAAVTLVRVTADDIDFTTARDTKRRWFLDRMDGHRLFVVWTGRWKSNCFEIDPNQFIADLKIEHLV